MPVSPASAGSGRDNHSLLGGPDLLPRQPIFRAGDLEFASEYLCGALALIG